MKKQSNQRLRCSGQQSEEVARDQKSTEWLRFQFGSASNLQHQTILQLLKFTTSSLLFHYFPSKDIFNTAVKIQNLSPKMNEISIMFNFVGQEFL